jgi:hypothetical protein
MVLSATGFLGMTGGPLFFLGEGEGRPGFFASVDFSASTLATAVDFSAVDGGGGAGPLVAIFFVGMSGTTGDTRPLGGDPFKSSDGR